MTKGGFAVWLVAALCLASAQGAGAQTLSLNGSSSNSSFAGPIVSGKIVANAAGTGVTVDAEADQSVTLTNGVFTSPGGSTTGSATYNSSASTITANCQKGTANGKCNGAFHVTFGTASGNGTFTKFNVTAVSCGATPCTISVSNNNSAGTSVLITGTSSGGADWTATFTLGVTGTFNSISASSSGTSSINYSISLN
jgi:hypothetical protein